jgi:hypothetical protein
MRFMTTVALISLRQMGGVSHGTDTSSMRRVVRLPGIGRALRSDRDTPAQSFTKL